MKTLLVYDLETSGLSVFDQVLQYAAIRLDIETLEEVERTEIEVAWRGDMIPSAEAFLVHQIPMNGREHTVSEASAIMAIHQALNQPGTISGGYNTLGFDDEMLRFSFYRTLLTPYTHQYKDACGRFDLLPITIFYYLFAQDILVWPKKTDGTPSFKLEDISTTNGWANGRAHDAMNDVVATVALLKHFRLNRPMWDYLMGYFDKSIDQQRIQALMKQPEQYQGVGIMIGLRFGYACHYMAPVLHLGSHHIYKNQAVFIRLDHLLTDFSTEALAPLLLKKKLAEPCFVLPYKDKYVDKLPEAVKATVDANLKLLHEKGVAIFNECRQQAYTAVEGVDIDADLYQQPFLTQEELTWCEKFHISDKSAKAKLLEQVSNSHLRLQALRFLYRFYPDQIPDQFVTEAQQSIHDSIHGAIDFRNKQRLSKEEALKQVEIAQEKTEDLKLLEGLSAIEKHLLEIK